MIVDGGTLNCLGKCHIAKITMGEFLLDSLMTTIQMGGVNVVLGVEWLQSFRIATLNFHGFFMRFSLKKGKLNSKY